MSTAIGHGRWAVGLGLIWCLTSPQVLARPQVRLLLSVGNNVGDPDDRPLRFADRDAERVRDVFVELGDVAAEHAYLLKNQRADVVRETLAEVSQRIKALAVRGSEVVLFVYVSSHARDGHLHLSGTHLPMLALRELTEATSARLRVLMIDACEGGRLARTKGGRKIPDHDVRFERLPLAGQVVITSSGSAEASEEWDALEGSLFTHHLLSGLRGDADLENDGQISLAEAYGYAYRRTVSGSTSMRQHPAFDFDVAGSGELMLTQPATSRAALRFAAETEGQFIITSLPRPEVVIELAKENGRPVRLAVPPGRYRVRKKQGHATGLLEIELPFGGEQSVREEELEWRNSADVALKGGSLQWRPSMLTLGMRALTEPLAQTGARWRGSVGFRRSVGALFWQGHAIFGRWQFDGEGVQVNEWTWGLGGSLGFRWLEFRLAPFLGVSLEAAWLRQSLSRDEEPILLQIGQPKVPVRNAVAVSGGLVLGLEVPLPLSMAALVWMNPEVRWLRVWKGRDWTMGAQGVVALGWRF